MSTLPDPTYLCIYQSRFSQVMVCTGKRILLPNQYLGTYIYIFPDHPLRTIFVSYWTDLHTKTSVLRLRLVLFVWTSTNVLYSVLSDIWTITRNNSLSKTKSYQCPSIIYHSAEDCNKSSSYLRSLIITNALNTGCYIVTTANKKCNHVQWFWLPPSRFTGAVTAHTCHRWDSNATRNIN